MNNHHLKLPALPLPASERTGHKMVIHDILTDRLGLVPFMPLRDNPYIRTSQKGRFHQSSCGLALYSNAFTQKAVFPQPLAPFGYLNRRYGELFSFGVYRRSDGELFGSLLPLTDDLKAIAEFTRLAVNELPIKGVYVRFLRLPEFSRLVSDFGFTSAKEEPWLRDAPEEDESLSHSKVDLRKVFTPDCSDIIFPPLKRNFNRAMNFLRRTGQSFTFVPLTEENRHVAWEIVQAHFEMLDKSGKLIGSTHHDYVGLLHSDILTLQAVEAHIGMLGGLPVSVFIGESNGQNCISGYAGITLRNINYLTGAPFTPSELDAIAIDERHGVDTIHKGSSAIPTYVFVRLFRKFFAEGYDYFYMGGSEHADIDRWKHKQMGAEKDPTYWAVYMKT